MSSRLLLLVDADASRRARIPGSYPRLGLARLALFPSWLERIRSVTRLRLTGSLYVLEVNLRWFAMSPQLQKTTQIARPAVASRESGGVVESGTERGYIVLITNIVPPRLL